METIKKGSRGNTVKEAQRLLNAKGYNAGNPDGIFGANTEKAVKAFQSAYGLDVDGIIGKNTWNSLEAEGNLQKGARGEKVKLVQNLLNSKGYNAGSADGIFGDNTAKAVKAFQSANGLSADGIVGPKTWAALNAGGGNGSVPQSAHFKLTEFACHNGNQVPDVYYGNCQRLMDLLEEIRVACGGRAITVISGYRDPAYNKGCGGAPLSQHLTASAADIQVSGTNPSTVYAIADRLNPNGGVGRYSTFTHVDVRNGRARW